MVLPVLAWRTAVAVQIVGEQVPARSLGVRPLAPACACASAAPPRRALTCSPAAQVLTPEGALRVVLVEEHFARMARFEVPLAAWLAENPGVPARAAGVSLHVLSTEAGEFFWLRRVLCEQSRESRLHFYTSKTHLVFDLQHNGGGPCAFEVLGCAFACVFCACVRVRARACPVRA